MEHIQIPLSQTTPVKCECGNEFFIQGFSLRQIPAILSPTLKKHIQAMPVFICMNCKTPIDLDDKPQKKA